MFSAPCKGQVVLSIGNHSEMLKTQLAVFRWTQKSALRDGLNVTGKNGSMPPVLPLDLSKDFCINPLIKITIQSKALFMIALHCGTVPYAASERQTLPPILKMSVLWNLYYLFAKRLIQIIISLAKNRSITLGRRLYNVSDISLPVLTNCRIGKKV